MLAAREAALATLRALGASVEETRVPFDLEDVMLRNGRIITAEAWALHRGYIEDETLPFDPGVRSRLLAAKAIGAADYIDELATALASVLRARGQRYVMANVPRAAEFGAVKFLCTGLRS